MQGFYLCENMVSGGVEILVVKLKIKQVNEK